MSPGQLVKRLSPTTSLTFGWHVPEPDDLSEGVGMEGERPGGQSLLTAPGRRARGSWESAGLWLGAEPPAALLRPEHTAKVAHVALEPGSSLGPPSLGCGDFVQKEQRGPAPRQPPSPGCHPSSASVSPHPLGTPGAELAHTGPVAGT